MPKSKVAGNPAHDATLPVVSIDLSGEKYNLCFDYGALSVAERKLTESGIKINMLAALNFSEIGAERLPIVFFAALLKAHPEMTFEQASALVTMRTCASIYEKVCEAYLASLAEPKPEVKSDERPLDQVIAE